MQKLHFSHINNQFIYVYLDNLGMNTRIRSILGNTFHAHE